MPIRIPVLSHSSMYSQQNNTTGKNAKIPADPTCTKPCCFFCNMNEPEPFLRRAKIAKFFKNMPHCDDQEHVLALSSLWKIAMTQPNDPEFPSLGIFKCMANLIHRGINDRDWLLRDQNIYIPYYAAHIIGSYTMNKAQFAVKAVRSGVVPPLMELMRGKISWVEQRVAVRALGHLASHERTFEAIALYEEEIVNLAMEIASTCLDAVYVKFVGVKDIKRLKYHCDLLTRGVGGLEIENRKAEEWASQLQCWSIHLLLCFACKQRSLNSICNENFLEDLCEMWSGLANRSSPAGIGLIRTLCYTKIGRKSIADLKEVIESLCNISRSSDDWQYMAIHCLLLLLKDPETRYKVIDFAALSLADLVEIRSIGKREKAGEAITQALLQDFHKIKYGNLKLKSTRAEKVLKEIWDLKVERRKTEKLMSEEEIRERKMLVALLKQEGNHKFWSGDIEEAVTKYSKGLDLCLLKMRKERVVLYSNRAQCHLLLKDPEAAISDSTRALSLSGRVNSHSKSLWRRSQAYDMKGLAKESLMDCLMFINGRMKGEDTKYLKIPYYAARMINKQMNATWIFASSKSKTCNDQEERREPNGRDKVDKGVMEIKDNNGGLPGASTTVKGAWIAKGRSRRKLERAGR
ncbi:hypothetical protein L1049_015848 [Liquidambar formosana]|uniref:ARM repeat N-terminal plant domain-containing protein n=1 Tax=Liquidambar formosana TaxID=63359 RepID=A0AAP0RU56_LIQFO